MHFVQNTQRTRLYYCPKVNMFCAITSKNVYSPFFVAEGTFIGTTYLDMLQMWLMPQLQNILMFILQQDRSPAHFHCEVRQYLNTVLPGCWILHAPENDQPLTLWPQSSPDITPCNIFFVICKRPGIRPSYAM